MFKTGNTVIDAASRIFDFLPLLPLLVIIVRHAYRQEALNFLMILCFLDFIQNLVSEVFKAPQSVQTGIRNIFLLLELLIFTQIFKYEFSKRGKEILLLLTIGFLSAILTYYLITGVDHEIPALEFLQNLLIGMLILYSLPRLVRQDNLRIFQSPYFWIGAGTLFYIVLALLMQFAEKCCLEISPQGKHESEKIILLSIANLVRYLFYTLAAWVTKPSAM